MKKTRRNSSRGMALVITLCMVVMITILAVGLSTAMRLERATARGNFGSLQARAFAEMALNQAVGSIRDATTVGLTNGKFWSSQPGKITVFNSDGTVDAASSRLLYSVSPTGLTDTVNLNQASLDGINPIASAASAGGTAPTISVQWVNVLSDPSLPAATNNQVVGRYAFWVDDETTKLNVNTADGSARTSTNWYGSGNPADVDLQALQSGGSPLSSAQAQSVAQWTGIQFQSATPAGAHFLNSASELGQISGVGTNVFSQNNFNLTYYSKAPELNIFGEPKIYLTVTRTAGTAVRDIMVGDYGYKGDNNGPSASTIPTGLPLTQIYPSSKQLPSFIGLAGTTNLPQAFEFDSPMDNPTDLTTSADYNLGYRIAQYLNGINSQGQAIQWPNLGTGNGGFAKKYTARQIDSITLQILSLMKRGVMADQSRAGSLPYVMMGWLSHQPVKGLGRIPKLNEVELVITATTVTRGTNSSIVAVKLQTYLEWYLPKEYAGYPLTQPYDRGGATGLTIGAGLTNSFLNSQDLSYGNVHSALGGYWRDNLLYFLDQTGTSSAGIDLNGNPTNALDPDQGKAQLYHPYTFTTNGYYGAGPGTPALKMNYRMADATKNPAWALGEYHCIGTEKASITNLYLGKQNVTKLYPRGGLVVWAGTESGNPEQGYNIDPVPIDSVHGLSFTGESMTNVISTVTNAVIPIPNNPDVSLPVPGQLTIHWEVADPMVNSMPGDWTGTWYHDGAHHGSMQYPVDDTVEPTQYTNGLNTNAMVAHGGDPASQWWPTQTNNVTMASRFPSAGYLQYIRTGMMPDYAVTNQPLANQTGTPYRMLNFAPASSASQFTAGGQAYPDWAMLDLFTVPAALQPLASSGTVSAYANLTAGGATAGRLNPNIPVLPSGAVSRVVPLQGLLRGQQVSTNISDSPPTNTVDEVALAQAINSYLTTLGRPLMVPGEICNIPAVAAYLYSGVTNTAQSRNDLVRNIIGNLTTRSNTFTVWAVGQAIKKRQGNVQYGQVEPGDIVVGESRMQFLVERYIDLGADGVPGNANAPGLDGVVGTPDDPVDPTYNPSMTYPLPYKFRVIAAKQVVR